MNLLTRSSIISLLAALYNLWTEKRFVRKLGESYNRAGLAVPARFNVTMANEKSVRKGLESFISQILDLS